MRATFAENMGDLEMMRSDVTAALLDFEEIGDRWGLSNALNSRGWIRSLEGDTEGAIADYERALECIHALGGEEDDLLVQLRLAGLRLRTGDVRGARSHLTAARRNGDNSVMGPMRRLIVDGADAHLLVMEGRVDAALAICDRLRSALADRGEVPWMRGHLSSLVLGATAGVALRLGNADQMEADLSAAYPAAKELKDMPIVAVVGVCVAGLAMLRGHFRQSAYVLGASARLRGADDFFDPTIAWLTEQLRTRLDGRFEAAYAEGKSMSVEACIQALDPAASSAPGGRR
jgi:tetratricopeptide (TPR) repeat protein